MLRFIVSDLRRHWAGVVAIILIVALATALGVAVTLQERALRLGSARAANAFDLVIGAPGSENQLVLSSVFLQAAPLPLMPGSVLAGLVTDPRVEWAAPVGFGDFIDSYPIVGTTPALVTGLGRLAEGDVFARMDGAVIGAAVGMRIGDHFHPQHGRVGEPGGSHTEITYNVVGRLAPTGTIWDRAVLVPIETVWLAHRHDAAGVSATGGTNPFLRTGDAHDAHDGEHRSDDGHPDRQADSGHRESDALSATLRVGGIVDPEAPGVPAIIVKPRTIADAYKLRQQFRSDRTLAVFPGEVLTRLYATLGDVRIILSAVAGGAQGLVGAAILLVVTVHVVQRRRQIGALRALGAPRLAVFAIVWGEVLLIAGLGLLLGFGLGYGAAVALSSVFATLGGFVLPVTFTAGDVTRLAALMGVAAVVASLPALLAYRQSPASALRS